MTPFYDHTMEEVAAMLTSGKDTWNTYVQMPSIQLLKCKVLLNICVPGLPAYDNTTVFVDRADEAYLEKLAEVKGPCCCFQFLNWIIFARCALRVPRTHGAGCSREEFPRLRTRFVPSMLTFRIINRIAYLRPTMKKCATTSYVPNPCSTYI